MYWVWYVRRLKGSSYPRGSKSIVVATEMLNPRVPVALLPRGYAAEYCWASVGFAEGHEETMVVTAVGGSGAYELQLGQRWQWQTMKVVPLFRVVSRTSY